MTQQEKNTLILTGIAGFLGALGVGIGEWLMQFTQAGKLDETTYNYFLDVKVANLSLGHFLCVLTGPLYFLGYLHLGKAIDRHNSWLGKAITGIGIYSFGVGIAWIGGRVYLGLGRKAVETAEASPELFRALAEHNEPFIGILRIAILLISILWVFGILKGHSYYPKWMALLSPILLLVSIFILYATLPSVGKYILPSAMNVTHLIVFGASIFHCLRIPVISDGET